MSSRSTSSRFTEALGRRQGAGGGIIIDDDVAAGGRGCGGGSGKGTGTGGGCCCCCLLMNPSSRAGIMGNLRPTLDLLSLVVEEGRLVAMTEGRGGGGTDKADAKRKQMAGEGKGKE